MRLSLAFVVLATACSSSSNPPADPPQLAIETFDVAEQPFGDAPVSVHFTWRIRTNIDKPLTCKLDVDGDGTVDTVLESCPLDRLSEAKDTLPAFTFTNVGEHAPHLWVDDGEGHTADMATTVFANRYSYDDKVVFPEKLAGFVKADVTEGSKSVTLTYDSPASVPAIANGAIVLGQSGFGYLMRVDTAVASGSTLTLDGTPAAINDAIKDGFFGARDVTLPIDRARCLDAACSDLAFEPVAPKDAPSGPELGGKSIGKSAAPLTLSTAGTFGVKIPFSSSKFEKVSGTIFVGLNIKKLVIDIGLFRLKRFELDMSPQLQGELTFTAKELFKHEWELGRISLGTVPIGPVVLTPTVFPVVRVGLNWGFTASFGMTIPVKAGFDGTKWSASADPSAFAGGSFLDPNQVKTSITAEACFVPKVNALIYGVAGPYAAPTMCLNLEGALQTAPVSAVCKGGSPVQLCVTGKATGGGEVGVEQPWFKKPDGEPYASVKQAFTLAELEMFPAQCLGAPKDDAPNTCEGDKPPMCTPTLGKTCTTDTECSCGVAGAEKVCARNDPNKNTCIPACHSDADCPAERPTCDKGVAGGVSEDEPHWTCVKCPTSGPPEVATCAKCEHDVCTDGTALNPSCSDCARKVCLADEYCCTQWWTASCRAKASALCGAGCP